MNRTHSSRREPAFGLLAWLGETRIALPLKGVECRWQVSGAVASVELDQIYHQDAGRAVDCEYTFPLPQGAAVYRCEIHLPDRVLRAVVREEGEARREYQAAKAAGRRAAARALRRRRGGGTHAALLCRRPYPLLGAILPAARIGRPSY